MYLNLGCLWHGQIGGVGEVQKWLGEIKKGEEKSEEQMITV